MDSHLHSRALLGRRSQIPLPVGLLACALLLGACGGSSPGGTAGAEAPERGASTSTVNPEAAEQAATRREKAELDKREEASIAAARKRRAALAAAEAASEGSSGRRRASAKRKKGSKAAHAKHTKSHTKAGANRTTTSKSPETAAERSARQKLEQEEAAEAREASRR